MKEKFNEVIKEYKERTKKDCYKIELTYEKPDIMDDKIGGIPYLPVGVEYPKTEDGEPLALLFQVNLKNIDLDGYPKDGILEIFTDKNVDYPCIYKVMYFEEGLDYQTDLPKIDTNYYITEGSTKIKLVKDVSYMSVDDYRFMDNFIPVINKVYNTDIKNYKELSDFSGDFDYNSQLMDELDNPQITVGGYPNFTQSDPRFTHKELTETLLKIDSIGEYSNFNIGDSGILFSFISKEDLENKNFDNAVVDWDCC